jgi:gluconolactonase
MNMDIDVRHPGLAERLDPGQPLERVATGFKFVEGPIWNAADRSLIFSDILGNSLLRWTEKTGVSLLRRNSYMANGNAYDRQGRILTCEHATSRVTRTDFANQGELEVLASHYQGKQLNSPNDIVCRRDGAIYFTDPASGRSPGYGVPRAQELNFQGVYRLDPNTLELALLVDDFVKPNGLCFTPDERKLFINDSQHNHIRVFEVLPDGSLAKGQVWASLEAAGTGVADGMKLDQAGNLYCSGPGGIHIFDAQAALLAIVHMPEQTANLAWGGDDLCSLYITASTSIYRLRTQIPGQATFSIPQAKENA